MRSYGRSKASWRTADAQREGEKWSSLAEGVAEVETSTAFTKYPDENLNLVGASKYN